MDPSAENAIRRIPASELTYEAFQRDFMLANQPVVVSGATESWRAFREWRTADGKPNLALLREKFGRSTVQVRDPFDVNAARAVAGYMCAVIDA